jgi:capsular exopolysaccharide synthesis family protein
MRNVDVDNQVPGIGGDEDQFLNFDVQRYLEGLRKYVWAVIALVALSIAGAVIYTQRQPKIYQAQASVQIEPRLPDLLGDHEDILTRTSVGGIDYYAQQQQVLGSYRLVRQTVEQNQLYNQLIPEPERADRKIDELIEDATQRLREDLVVKYPDQNRIMYVIVRNQSPELAAQIANAHVATYVDYSKGLLSTDTRNASGALSTEFDDAETKLRDAESALYQFQKDNDLLAVTLEERQNMVSTGISAYTAKLNEAHARRLELQAKLDRMKAAADKDVLESPILLMAESTSFDTLRAEYYSERNKFIELEKELGPKNTQYQMQKAKVDDLYAALQSETKRILSGFDEQVQAQIATENAFRVEVEKATKQALELGPKVVAYNELARRKKSAEDRYTILRSRLSTTELNDRMSRNFDTSNVRPLDPALAPTIPVSPSLRVNITVAAVLALFLGLGLVVLVVFLDRSIKTTSDVQQTTSLPILGIIPSLDDAELPAGDQAARDLYVHREPTSAVAEYCRSLRTNILFSTADRQAKTIVVSSANPRDGKTTSVIYLGTTMAQSGQRVLLIDTDMRRPRLHVSLGVPRTTGLSNLIVGDQDFDRAIAKTEVPNLDVLPCGPLPPNPAELLMTHRFEAVLAELGKRYDRILLDSPPLQVVTDAVVLSKQTDGVILVVHAGTTLRDDLKRSERTLRAVGGKIFGVIVNAIEPDHRSGYYYSYYGYTEKPDESEQPA